MHGFVVDFADWSALRACRDHPDHKRLGAGLKAAAVGGSTAFWSLTLALANA